VAERPLLLVAAGGLAREATRAATSCGRVVLGCLDDDPDRHDTRLPDGTRVLGSLEDAVRHPDADVLVCAGKGEVRRALVDRLRGLGVPDDRFTTLVHSAAHLAPGTDLAPGVLVLAGVVATSEVRLGAHVVCMPNVVLTHDDVVEPYATLCAGVVLGGGVTVGAGAYLGMGCSVREGVAVGQGAVVGMGSVVLHDVGPGETWVGVPARRLPSTPADVSAGPQATTPSG